MTLPLHQQCPHVKKFKETQRHFSSEALEQVFWENVESFRIRKCRNRKVSELESIRNCLVWKCQKLHRLESFRIGKCQKLLDWESVKNCSDWKVSEIAQIGKLSDSFQTKQFLTILPQGQFCFRWKMSEFLWQFVHESIFFQERAAKQQMHES